MKLILKSAVKKIIIFNSGSFVYGAERGLLNLIKALKSDFDITVVIPQKGPLVEKIKEVSLSVKIIIFPLAVLMLSFFPFYLLKFIFLSFVDFFYFLFYIKNNEADIILTNNLLLLFPALLAKLIGKKHIWCIREFFNYRFINRLIGDRKSVV